MYLESELHGGDEAGRVCMMLDGWRGRMKWRGSDESLGLSKIVLGNENLSVMCLCCLSNVNVNVSVNVGAFEASSSL